MAKQKRAPVTKADAVSWATILGLIFVGMGFIQSRDAAVDASRAWIAIAGAAFQGPQPIKIGDSVAVVVLYENIGKQPALDVEKFQETFWIDAGDIPPATNAEEIPIAPNDTCAKVTGKSGIGAVWPTNGKSYISWGPAKDTIVVGPNVQQQKVLAVHGCFKYVTFRDPHITGFCFFLNPIAGQTIQNGIWSLCPGQNQNFAN